ncbi:MAG: hypothetical protein WD425_09605 [Nitrospirales bacterium]
MLRHTPLASGGLECPDGEALCCGVDLATARSAEGLLNNLSALLFLLIHFLPVVLGLGLTAN